MRLHHFTSPYNASAILVMGLIRRTDGVLAPGPATVDTTSGNPPREVVHLTRDPEPHRQMWSQHVNLQTGRADGWIVGEYDKRRIRFTVSETRVEPWIDVAVRSGTPQSWIDALARTGGDGALMPNYYVCDRDIPRRKWRLVEDTESGEVLWRRPMLHEYPDHWREQMPYYFDFSQGKEGMLAGLNAHMAEWLANPVNQVMQPLQVERWRDDGTEETNRRTIDAWWDDYAEERTEEEWIEHLRTFDEYGDSPERRLAS